MGDDAGKTVYDRASHLLNHPEQVRLKLLPRAEQFQVYDHVLVVVCARIIAGNYLCPLLPSRRHGICNPAKIQDIRRGLLPKAAHPLCAVSLETFDKCGIAAIQCTSMVGASYYSDTLMHDSLDFILLGSASNTCSRVRLNARASNVHALGCAFRDTYLPASIWSGPLVQLSC